MQVSCYFGEFLFREIKVIEISTYCSAVINFLVKSIEIEGRKKPLLYYSHSPDGVQAVAFFSPVDCDALASL